jgi:hypothetical protein
MIRPVVTDRRRAVKVRRTLAPKPGGSLDDEESRVDAAGPDDELHPAGAPRAVADVGRSGTIGINARVDVAAGEMDAQKA